MAQAGRTAERDNATSFVPFPGTQNHLLDCGRPPLLLVPDHVRAAPAARRGAELGHCVAARLMAQRAAGRAHIAHTAAVAGIAPAAPHTTKPPVALPPLAHLPTATLHPHLPKTCLHPSPLPLPTPPPPPPVTHAAPPPPTTTLQTKLSKLTNQAPHCREASRDGPECRVAAAGGQRGGDQAWRPDSLRDCTGGCQQG